MRREFAVRRHCSVSSLRAVWLVDGGVLATFEWWTRCWRLVESCSVPTLLLAMTWACRPESNQHDGCIGSSTTTFGHFPWSRWNLELDYIVASRTSVQAARVLSAPVLPTLGTTDHPDSWRVDRDSDRGEAAFWPGHSRRCHPGDLCTGALCSSLVGCGLSLSRNHDRVDLHAATGCGCAITPGARRDPRSAVLTGCGAASAHSGEKSRNLRAPTGRCLAAVSRHGWSQSYPVVKHRQRRQSNAGRRRASGAGNLAWPRRHQRWYPAVEPSGGVMAGGATMTARHDRVESTVIGRPIFRTEVFPDRDSSKEAGSTVVFSWSNAQGLPYSDPGHHSPATPYGETSNCGNPSSGYYAPTTSVVRSQSHPSQPPTNEPR